MLPVSRVGLYERSTRCHELSYRLGVESQHLGGRVPAVAVFERALGLGVLHPTLGRWVLAVIVVRGDGPQRGITNHMNHDVAGRHGRNALEELWRCPHFYFVGPGAAQLVVKARTLPLVRFHRMNGQRAAHSARQDAAEVMASLVVVEEADTMRRSRCVFGGGGLRQGRERGCGEAQGYTDHTDAWYRHAYE